MLEVFIDSDYSLMVHDIFYLPQLCFEEIDLSLSELIKFNNLYRALPCIFLAITGEELRDLQVGRAWLRLELFLAVRTSGAQSLLSFFGNQIPITQLLTIIEVLTAGAMPLNGATYVLIKQQLGILALPLSFPTDEVLVREDVHRVNELRHQFLKASANPGLLSQQSVVQFAILMALWLTSNMPFAMLPRFISSNSEHVACFKLSDLCSMALILLSVCPEHARFAAELEDMIYAKNIPASVVEMLLLAYLSTKTGDRVGFFVPTNKERENITKIFDLMVRQVTIMKPRGITWCSNSDFGDKRVFFMQHYAGQFNLAHGSAGLTWQWEQTDPDSSPLVLLDAFTSLREIYERRLIFMS
jgi:hypothetical protein